jgi:hypothetical protein
MHCDIVELTNQLGRQAQVIGDVPIHFFVSSGSNLQQQQQQLPTYFTFQIISPKYYYYYYVRLHV